MKKRLLSIIMTLCLILTMFMSVPVFAAGGITINKTSYTVGEAGEATITGLSDQEIEDGAFLAIEETGTRLSNAIVQVYIIDLPSDNVWEFEAPITLGSYELLLLDYENNLISKAAFTVGSPKAQPGDITLSKAEAKLLEPLSVTVKGLTDEQFDNGAWMGISKWDEKMINTIVEIYLSDLPSDNTHRFNAPNRFGKYEVRVFSDSSDDYEATFFGKAEFLVVSSKAKPGDIVLSKSSVSPEEKLSVTVKGLTQGELDENAWLGIAKSSEKLENTTTDTYLMYLPVNNTYEFTAPSEPGTYEVRVFCSGATETPEEYQYGLFGTAQFIVSGTAAETNGYTAGYEGLAPWAAPVVTEAVNENLTTDKVLLDFPSPITREEFCELAVLLYEKMSGTKAATPAANPFNDTNNPEILKAADLGIVGGVGGGKFAPNNNVTRQEISLMLLRTLKAVMPSITATAEFKTQFQDVGSVDSWALEAVRFMNANDIVTGSTVNGVSYILPKGNTTKEQAIALVLRIYNKFNKL